MVHSQSTLQRQLRHQNLKNTFDHRQKSVASSKFNFQNFFHRLVILLFVILLFNMIVDINIDVLAYLTQFINMYRAPRNVVATFTQNVTRWHFRKAKFVQSCNIQFLIYFKRICKGGFPNNFYPRFVR
jgi:hypothetical protein